MKEIAQFILKWFGAQGTNKLIEELNKLLEDNEKDGQKEKTNKPSK